jgi:hypothetical protein
MVAMSESIPTFAIVGAVNHGKSSVVSTLAENDQVRISSMPGETVTCQRFWLRDLFAFYDTPGFRMPSRPFANSSLPRAREPLAVFRDFLTLHSGQQDFEAECRLLEPIVKEDAGIIYVVDGSEPLLEIHLAEMEILRLTGQPRLAIINRTKSEDHLEEWRRRLGLHFNAVREFNAHLASFLTASNCWKPRRNRAAVEVATSGCRRCFPRGMEKRLDDCADIIVELLGDALTHRESAAGPNCLRAKR